MGRPFHGNGAIINGRFQTYSSSYFSESSGRYLLYFLISFICWIYWGRLRDIIVRQSLEEKEKMGEFDEDETEKENWLREDASISVL